MTKAALEWFDDLERDDDCWIERAKIDFAVDLERMMERRGMRKADLAERLGTSPAYITKAMRGDVNFTIGSMVRLARAVEGNLHIHIAAKTARVRWLDIQTEFGDKD